MRDFTWVDQDWIGLMIFKNFADQDWTEKFHIPLIYVAWKPTVHCTVIVGFAM